MKYSLLLIVLGISCSLTASPSDKELARKIRGRGGRPGEDTMRAARTVKAITDATGKQQKKHRRQRSASESDLSQVAAAVQNEREPADVLRREKMDKLRRALIKNNKALGLLLEYQQAQSDYDNEIALRLQGLQAELGQVSLERDKEERRQFRRSIRLSVPAQQGVPHGGLPVGNLPVFQLPLPVVEGDGDLPLPPPPQD